MEIYGNSRKHISTLARRIPLNSLAESTIIKKKKQRRLCLHCLPHLAVFFIIIFGKMWPYLNHFTGTEVGAA